MLHMKGDTMQYFEKDDGGGTGGGDDGQKTEPSGVEVLAMKMGWNPEHDESSGRDFKTADQYILDSKEIQNTTIKTLKSVKAQNDELVHGMQHLQETHKRSAKIEKTRLEDRIAVLKGERDAAIGDADAPKVHEIDAKIKTAEGEVVDIDQSAQKPDAQKTANFESHSNHWVEQNPWYGKNDTMTKYIDTQCERFRGLPPDLYFQRLTEVAKASFPDQFTEGQDTSPAAAAAKETPRQAVVGGQTRQTGAGGKKTYGYDDLTGEQKKMASFFKKNKVMEIQEYVDEQVKIGNIQGS